uniref:NOGCT domain-containing protein n=1 Tax=Rhabditophanes sp. KR3021 TaxID=114890 RepID=A0AC35U8T8_9BILA
MQTDNPEKDLAPYRDSNTRRLERKIEIEMGNRYTLNLKKKYLLKNEDEKYDAIPKIWKDETTRVYDQDMETDDEETRRLLDISKNITEKKIMIRYGTRDKNRINVPKVSRAITRYAETIKEKLQRQRDSLGINVSDDKPKNLHAESAKLRRGKRMDIVFLILLLNMFFICC